MKFHKLIFIGLLFVFIDIKIEAFDIVPDLIGYIFILVAFMKVGTPYANLGIVTTMILLGDSLIPIESTSEVSFMFDEEIISYSVSEQLIGLLIGVTSILNFACMFAVSNALIPMKGKRLPKIFIALLVLMQIALSFVYYLTIDEISLILISLGVATFITYILVLVFFSRRSKEEQLPKKPSDDDDDKDVTVEYFA